MEVMITVNESKVKEFKKTIGKLIAEDVITAYQEETPVAKKSERPDDLPYGSPGHIKADQ